MRYTTYIITFTPTQILIERVFDFGVNVFFIGIHIIKENSTYGDLDGIYDDN